MDRYKEENCSHYNLRGAKKVHGSYLDKELVNPRRKLQSLQLKGAKKVHGPYLDKELVNPKSVIDFPESELTNFTSSFKAISRNLFMRKKIALDCRYCDFI